MYFLTEIRVDDFENGVVSVQGRFKLVSRCADPSQRSSAEVFQAVNALESNDQRQAIKGLKHFVKLAQLGKPFNQLTDSKAVHEAFEPFTVKLQEEQKRCGGIGTATFGFCFITRQTKLSCWRTRCQSGATSFLKRTKNTPVKR